MKKRIYIYVIALFVLTVSIINVRLNNSKYRTLLELSKLTSLTQEHNMSNEQMTIPVTLCVGVQPQDIIGKNCKTVCYNRNYNNSTNKTTALLCCASGGSLKKCKSGIIYFDGNTNSTNWDNGRAGSVSVEYICKN
ncbi:MAG: hypothetical protein LBG80_16620 [Bacteroidales bacterium]|jgi:hypothetical protein|nr:hypothetical protein [Bacteroidales bacterium]